MEKLLVDTNEREVNDYLSKGWKVKMMNTPVSLGGNSSCFLPEISLYVVLEKDHEGEAEKEQTEDKTEQTNERNTIKIDNETTDTDEQVQIKKPERLRCSIDGCDGWVYKDGICHFHYFQKYNHF